MRRGRVRRGYGAVKKKGLKAGHHQFRDFEFAFFQAASIQLSLGHIQAPAHSCLFPIPSSLQRCGGTADGALAPFQKALDHLKTLRAVPVLSMPVFFSLAGLGVTGGAGALPGSKALKRWGVGWKAAHNWQRGNSAAPTGFLLALT